MGLTHFPNGVSTPLLVGPNASIVVPNGSYPSAVGQVNGYAGVQFVSATSGSDSYSGLTPARPLKNLDTAFYRCTGGQNEIIYVLGSQTSVNFSTGNSWSPASASTGLLWNKNETHLVGLAAPGSSGTRAHISNGASTNLFTPLITVSGNGCYFSNVELFNGGAHATEAAVCLLVTGSYNCFENCQISGGGNATSAADVSCRSLVITGNGTGGGGENTFRHCYIGLTTVPRGGAAASELEMTAHTPRNWFEDCTFAGAASVSTCLLVKIGAGGIQDFVVFRNCMFINPGTSHGSDSIYAQAMSVNAAPDGVVMLHNCLSGGATVCFTKFQTTASGVVFGDNPGSAASTYGIAATS